MKSKSIFRHLRNNILKYAVTFSAVVHLIGIFLFPTWGTVPNVMKEKIIRIKTVVIPPEKPVQPKLSEREKVVERKSSKQIMKPQSIPPQVRKKTLRVKSTAVVAPSPAAKKLPAPVDRPAQLYKPVKAILKNSSNPHPKATFQKPAEIKLPLTHPTGPTPEKTKSSHIALSTILSQRQVSKTFLNTSQTKLNRPARQVTSTSEISSPRSIALKKPFANMASANDLQISPTPFYNSSRTTGHKIQNSIPSIHPRKIQHQKAEASFVATGMKTSVSTIASVQKLEVQARSPETLVLPVFSPSQQAMPVLEQASLPPPGTIKFLQMSAIPLGFGEETVNQNGGALSKNGMSTDKKNEISADRLGEIKLAFSSQVRTKIAQTKFYPPTARRRGFEGEPVVAFMLGSTGDLLEISIKSPSQHKLLNDAALNAVRSASPYPPIPELLKVKTLRFKLPISFILEEP